MADPGRRLRVDPVRPEPEVLRRVAQLLLAGEVVAAPSDTVYGFLALPSSGKARSTLARLKGRSENFLLLVGSWEDVRSWTQDVPEEMLGRLRRVWPGPVTAVLPARTGRPAATRGTLGLRMPDSVFLRGLLERVGEPLLSTSANRPGLPAPTRAEEVEAEFPEVPLVLDGGPSASALPSTVVDLTVSPPRVLRRGRGDVEPLLDPPGTAS